MYPLALENIPRHWTGNQLAFLYFGEGLFFLLEESRDLSLVPSPETHHIADSKMMFSFWEFYREKKEQPFSQGNNLTRPQWL